MKIVNKFECSFCGNVFNSEDECFGHEISVHHDIASRQAVSIKKYCCTIRLDDSLGGCKNCQFLENGNCKIGSPIDWDIAIEKED